MKMTVKKTLQETQSAGRVLDAASVQTNTPAVDGSTSQLRLFSLSMRHTGVTFDLLTTNSCFLEDTHSPKTPVCAIYMKVCDI